MISKAFADNSSPGFPGGVRDFAAYWAAARLLLTDGNPYSPSELLALQRAVGLAESTPLIMWNPPWILSFIWPFGLLDFTISQFLWLILNVFLVLFSSHQLLKLYGGSQSKAGVAWLLAFTFTPTVYALILGQVTPVILFGLATFLSMERKKNWIGIGLVLALMSIKPHFLYLFWIAAALWLGSLRDWRIACAIGLAGLTAGLLPLLFDSAIYSNYIRVYQSADYLKPLDLPVPSLRNVVKVLFNLDGFLIEHLPTAAGAVWILIYWRRHRLEWVWTEHLPLILLVSIVTSPYSWTYDHIVLLPAVIQTYSWLRDRATSVMTVYLTFNAIYLTARYFVPLDFWYFWMAPLFLSVYLLFGKGHRNQTLRADTTIAWRT
jgi:hypothetical protein